MGAEGSWRMELPPTLAPSNSQRQEHWKHFDDSVNAVSFGFVATAILIFMFLLMAIFERFHRQTPTDSTAPTRMNLQDQMVTGRKLQHPSSKITSNGRGVLVLMPGEEVPTFIAYPAPAHLMASPS